MMKAEIKFTTDPAPVIKGLKASLAKRGMVRAVRESIQPVKAAVTQGAAAIQRYGFLSKSIGQKIKAYKAGVIGVIGPTSKFRRRKGVRKRGKNKGQPIWHQPSKYAALVERGTRRSRARAFLKPALTATSARYLETVRAKIQEEIEAELAKVKK